MRRGIGGNVAIFGLLLITPVFIVLLAGAPSPARAAEANTDDDDEFAPEDDKKEEPEIDEEALKELYADMMKEQQQKGGGGGGGMPEGMEEMMAGMGGAGGGMDPNMMMGGGGGMMGGMPGMGQGHAEPKEPVKISENTWAVTATTPMQAESQQYSHIMMNDRSMLSPYVHWICHHQTSQEPHHKDKIQCCQKLYDRMLEDSGALCWEKRACPGIENDGHRKFLHYCTERLVELPIEEASSKKKKKFGFEPRFSLLVAPETDRLDFLGVNSADSLQTQQWRQYLWFSNQKKGQWHYSVTTSPLDLAMDVTNVLPGGGSDTEKKKEEKDASGTYSAKLTTTMVADAEEESDRRSLNHELHLHLKAVASTDIGAKHRLMTAKLSVIYFMPEDMKLVPFGGKNTHNNNGCSVSCGDHDTFDKCSVEFSNPKIKSVIGKEEVIVVDVGAESSSIASSDDDDDDDDIIDIDMKCTIKFNANVVMDDDDEDLIIGAPILASSDQSQVQLLLGDHDNPKQATKMDLKYELKADGGHRTSPLTTNLEYYKSITTAYTGKDEL